MTEYFKSSSIKDKRWWKNTQALTGGVCFSWRMIERIREMSLLFRLAFGLKSHSLAILSHSWPGSSSVGWLTSSFSAFLNDIR